ncbi:Phosphatidylglycerol/phosphatidylinositol transfer protein [Penicillium rolfsii]|nr:Phosphatidylglycerol/phosphatidylinositol transfer protein [Penicillium rolfsii]
MQTLTITASGTLHETITKGAVVNVEVKWGVITLVKQTMDLCDQIENVDLNCPLEKGSMVLTKQVDLPKQIPPGRYSVLADVYTKDEKKVTCLKADNIEFKIKF